MQVFALHHQVFDRAGDIPLSHFFAAETVCLAPTCSGDRLSTAGTCDGLGTCRPQGVQTCDPYQCIDGACVGRCTGDSDCVSGVVGEACGARKKPW